MLQANIYFLRFYFGSSFYNLNFSLIFFQISQHVEHNDAILLVIIPATQVPEISSSRALRIAKEYDADSGSIVKLASLYFLLKISS